MLQQVIENLKQQDVDFYITNAIGPVRDTFSLRLNDYMTEKTMFSTISDAITYIDKGFNVNAQQALQTNSKSSTDNNT